MTDDYYYVILSPIKIGIPPKLYLEPTFTNKDNLLVWNYIFNKSDVISNLYDIYKEGGASYIFSRNEIPLPSHTDQPPPTNNEPDEPPWLPAEVAGFPFLFYRICNIIAPGDIPRTHSPEQMPTWMLIARVKGIIVISNTYVTPDEFWVDIIARNNASVLILHDKPIRLREFIREGRSRWG